MLVFSIERYVIHMKKKVLKNLSVNEKAFVMRDVIVVLEVIICMVNFFMKK